MWCIVSDGVLHEPREGVITQPRAVVPKKVFDEWKPGDECPVSYCHKKVEDVVLMQKHWNLVHVEFVPYLWCNMCSQSQATRKIFYTKKKMALIPHLTKDHRKVTKREFMYMCFAFHTISYFIRKINIVAFYIYYLNQLQAGPQFSEKAIKSMSGQTLRVYRVIIDQN